MPFERWRIDLHTGLADLLLDIQLYRQAMAVPARHIRGIKTTQCLALDDDVLQYLVNGMADMDIAIGIGRAIMQHKPWTALS